MAEQLCSNPWGTALVKAKIGTNPQKSAKNDQNLGVGPSYRMNKPLREAIVSLEFHEIAGFTLKKVAQNSNSDAGCRTVFNAGSRIDFRTTFQTHISKRVFMNEISSSALLDIQLTLFCVCEVDSFLPELEHLYDNVVTVSFPNSI